jgi:transposase
LTDTIGRPFVIELTAGNVSDITVAPILFERSTGARYVLGDKGYDADWFRRQLRRAGTVPVIPGRITRKRAISFDKSRYRERHRVENAFCRIKDFRRVATRYDKLAANFLSTVALAVLLAFWL